jgi:cytochrome c-type biogenesis protein
VATDQSVPWVLAVSAGSVAALNPCGFALLPAYLSLLVLGGQERSRRAAVGRALVAAAAMTAGFAGVFVTFGLVLAPVAGVLQRRLPWFTVVLGLLLVASGGWLLAGRALPGLPGLARGGPALRWSVPAMAGFGAAYALASLSCTVGPFLAIVVSAFRAGSVGVGVGLFAAYAAGMGVVVAAASLAVALARSSIVAGLRRLAPLVARLGGAVMLLAGTYVAYYGWYEAAVLGGADPQDPVIELASSVQQWLAGQVASAWAVALAAAVVLLAMTWVRWSPGGSPRTPSEGRRRSRGPWAVGRRRSRR